MSDVKRYDCTNGGSRYCQGCYTMTETPLGDYVSSDDYDALEAEAQALREEAAALRARVVVLPDRAQHDAGDSEHSDGCVRGFNDCLDELARLNGRAVSEGLLRRMLRDWESNDTVALWGDMEELQELLGEGKENE